MKVRIARRAGFCMGVRRAMRLALKAAETSSKPVYTYGPLIHNPQVLALLERIGVRDLHRSAKAEDGVVIIRAHGIPPREKKALLSSGLEVIDGTCPRVAKVQALARKYSREGYRVIIIGDRDHAEVRGILGYTGGQGLVVSNLRDLEQLPPLEKYVILSQTTQDEEVFEMLSREILSRFPGGKVINTICHATHVRQESVRELARSCEAIIVVGGRGSANTNRLAQIAREEGCEALLVETPEEIPLEEISRFRTVGVSAGASTPNWIINGVVERLAEHRNPLRRWLRLSLYLHLPLALSAALLLAGTGLWFKGGVHPPGLLLVFLMVFFAHTWNSLVAREILALCHPYKAALYRRHEKILVPLLLLGFTLSLGLAYLQGPVVFVFTALAGGGSALYSLTSLRRLFPGNRPLFVAFFWTLLILVVASLPPLWSLKAGALVYLLVFYQIFYQDILDLLEDGFLGRESLAAFLEEKRALKLLGLLPGGGLILNAVLFLSGGSSYLFLLPLWVYLWFLARYLGKKPLGRRLILEYLSLSPSLLYLLLGFLARGF
ncbi:MAG TPA: 4-hydroxy-3-methylbut-2-enyl diphosphate reductase [Thermosulfurimonas dismutans]|uniref:4-hydroxy-3-methylbut-2-enyl diphosphate reductase n=1 Tax=Thermosulfurimonas dismutans TaxID=999894 RepID=A0A7C3CP90_9BACT|nr:4-hydroxy-3-methylbut-2-enyl diphosphate reductase [Thermosulfurimonas dismutans]